LRGSISSRDASASQPDFLLGQRKVVLLLRGAMKMSRSALISFLMRRGFNFSLFQLQIHFLPVKCALFIHQTSRCRV
jgi:hypothetical protein